MTTDVAARAKAVIRDCGPLYDWSDADRRALEELLAQERDLPPDAPRALLSVRLSVFTDETTSPVRQHLDLRRLARDKGMRVVGTASDLGVSAVKVPPWKRPELSKWIIDRVPEFDAILFWKLDRFIRNMGDLQQMIQWASRYNKNLISKQEQIDLDSIVGKIMVMIIGGVAEIEAANTKVRVESLWAHAKTQEEWVVGKAPFGYKSEKGSDGRRRLVIDEHQAEQLRYARRRLIEGATLAQTIRELQAAGLANDALTVGTLQRRLRSPGTLGWRVEEVREGPEKNLRRSRKVIGPDGNPIRVGSPIFTDEQWDELQAALDKRAKQPANPPSRATRFLGVLICSDCGSHMTVKHDSIKPRPNNRIKTEKNYSYLRCQSCRSGGVGAPHPEAIYDAVVEQVLQRLGDVPVQYREYARGADTRKKIEDLQQRIEYYMKGLEPGGQYAANPFTRDKATASMNALIAELGSLDPESAEDRWLYTDTGKTFRQHWNEGGMDAMAEDLRRIGATVVVTRTKVPRQRAPQVRLELRIPTGYVERLVRTADDFTLSF